jgi:hypothetical protein
MSKVYTLDTANLRATATHTAVITVKSGSPKMERWTNRALLTRADCVPSLLSRDASVRSAAGGALADGSGVAPHSAWNLFRGFAAAESGCAIISHTADLSPIERRFPPDLSST